MQNRYPSLMTTLILSLIAAPDSRALDGATIAKIENLVPASARGAARWLAADEAWEIGVTCGGDFGLDDLALLVSDGIAADLLGTAPVDINVVPGTRRRKKLLIADMDSTIIQQECIDEMADVVGIKPQISAITERAMRGELAFEDALRERLGLIAGLKETQLADVYKTRITEMPGGRTLLATMRKSGAFTALVSGGFTFFTARVASAVGFETHRANALEIVDGVMTGRIIGPILGKEGKLANLEAFAAERRLDLADTLAVGDGANDLAMIGAAGLGVAYRAKPIVAAEAQASVRHGNLTALLYLQGYDRAEFVGDQAVKA
jgi:phosphoserine phosphatase